jgi:hypothetical protein
MPPPCEPAGLDPIPHPELEPDISWARSNGERMDLGMTVDALLGIGLADGRGP